MWYWLRMRKALLPMIILLGLAVLVRYGGSFAQETGHSWFLPVVETVCWPNNVAAGALPGQPPPVFCSVMNEGPDTSIVGENAWTDEFDHGLSLADFEGTHYRIFDGQGAVYKTIHWRHANHWMVDVAPHHRSGGPGHGKGGAMLRPDQSFRFEDDKLIVEATAAASMEAYDDNAWVEILVSTGAQPQGYAGLAVYGYDMFPEYWTLGCRLQVNRRPVCALKDDSGDYEGNRAARRLWEMSWFQEVGTEVYGGNELDGRGDYWHVCAIDDPDLNCRDHFKLELTATSLVIYVNDYLYFRQSGIPPLPAALTEGDVYVYFSSIVTGHSSDTVRFHWDRLAVNPAPTTALPSR